MHLIHIWHHYLNKVLSSGSWREHSLKKVIFLSGIQFVNKVINMDAFAAVNKGVKEKGGGGKEEGKKEASFILSKI